MREFTVSETDSGQRLDKYISRLIPLAPKSFLYKALRNKDIRLNGRKAEGNETVCAGDAVLFRFPDVQFADLGGRVSTEHGKTAPILESVPEKQAEKVSASSRTEGLKSLGKYCRILYEDGDILLADKKSGVLSQKAKPEDVSINEALLDYCGGKTELFTPSVCNRLDRNTSGLIIFAKTYRGAREMAAALKDRSAAKYYLAAVKGSVSSGGYLKARLVRKEKENKVEILPAEGEKGDLVETSYEPVAHTEKNGESFTLLKIDLITGKTHQIRAHLASVGMPVLGDAKYGNPERGRRQPGQRLMLHSYELYLPERGSFHAPIPAEFQKLFGVGEQL